MTGIDLREVAQVAARALRPPVRDPRFWVVQALVLAIAAAHELADAVDFLLPVGIPAFATVALFLVPIVYAALNFGLTGSLATAALVTCVTIPDFFAVDRAEHHWVDGVQLAIIDTVALFVGQRVERERLARERAEGVGEAYRKAEERYRALFETSHAPILLIAAGGRVRESNPAAERLLGADLRGRPAAQVLGVAESALAANQVGVIQLHDARGEVRDVHPVTTRVETEDGEFVQVVLDDVTEERRERERLSAFAGDLLRAQEEERRRIGQELHDEPLQALIQLYRRLEGSEPDRLSAARTEIAGAAAMLDAVIGDLRELARGLRPPALDELGLVAALRRAVDEFGERNALEARVDVTGEARRLSPGQEIAIFRIVQEALHNVERHAAARHVSLRLDFREHDVRLAVEDDGIGFEVAETRRSTRSLGLVGMDERAQLLGGSLDIQSRPDHGTVVVAQFPD